MPLVLFDKHMTQFATPRGEVLIAKLKPILEVILKIFRF